MYLYVYQSLLCLCFLLGCPLLLWPVTSCRASSSYLWGQSCTLLLCDDTKTKHSGPRVGTNSAISACSTSLKMAIENEKLDSLWPLYVHFELVKVLQCLAVAWCAQTKGVVYWLGTAQCHYWRCCFNGYSSGLTLGRVYHSLLNALLSTITFQHSITSDILWLWWKRDCLPSE